MAAEVRIASKLLLRMFGMMLRTALIIALIGLIA